MLLPPMTFLATYLCLIILPVITAILLAFTELPPATRNRGAPVPFRTIIARRNFLTAVVCSMVGYGTMNLVMASTPLTPPSAYPRLLLKRSTYSSQITSSLKHSLQNQACHPRQRLRIANHLHRLLY